MSDPSGARTTVEESELPRAEIRGNILGGGDGNQQDFGINNDEGINDEGADSDGGVYVYFVFNHSLSIYKSSIYNS